MNTHFFTTTGFRSIAFSVFLFIGTFHVALGESLSQEQQSALNNVINQLTQPSSRQELLKNDKKAQDADKFLKEVGGEYSEEIYQLAGKIMENLVQQAQGDPHKMEQILEKAQKDPAAFANTFTEEQKRQLKDLGKKIDSKKVKSLP